MSTHEIARMSDMDLLAMWDGLDMSKADVTFVESVSVELAYRRLS